MTVDNINKIKVIISELLNEFDKERQETQEEYDKIDRKISELDENISNYGENADLDFGVFSPLNISKNNEQLDLYNKERSDIEEKSIRLSKKLRYYNNKCESLNEVLNIINGENIKNDEYDDISKFFNVNLKDSGLSKYEKEVKKQEEERVYTNIGENKDKDPFEELIKRNQSRSNISEFKNNEQISKIEVSKKEDSNNELNNSDIINNQNRNDNLKSDLGLSKATKNSVIEDLKRVSHRIELGYKIIDQDTRRTKMELKSIKSNLDDVIKIIE